MWFAPPALEVFASLPWRERLFVRARLASAPLDEIASRVRGGRMLDVGCGHGVLCALVSQRLPATFVMGIDPDPRKIDWARASIGRRPLTDFRTTTVEALALVEAASFDTITVADVLYLLPERDHHGFLVACHRLLKPGGSLLLKEAEDDGGWRTAKALAQERLMVRLLRRTRSSGGLGFSTREQLGCELQVAGFRVENVVSLARFSTTPHVLFTATCM